MVRKETIDGMLRIVVMIGLLCCAHGACAASALIERLEAGQDQTVVVYGTSLTAGGAWVSQLSTSLNESYTGQLTWVNSGLSGKASNSGVANLAEEVLAESPDAVFIEFAMNDAFTAYEPGDIDLGITPAQSQANLNSMIDSILGQNPDCEIILQTMNPAWDAPNGNQSGSKRPNLATYYQGYRDVAQTRGLAIVDNNTIWEKLRSNQLSAFNSYVSDGVHPNAAGYAHLVTPALRHVLGANNDLALLIDPNTGRAVLQNQSPAAIELISYTISSSAGALLTNWKGLAERDLANWYEANPTSQNLSELNPLGELALQPGAAVDFGNLWNTAGGLDVNLNYQTPNGVGHLGTVVYTSLLPEVGAVGDFDADGDVDGRDFLKWQRDCGSTVPQFSGADGDGNGLVDASDLVLWEQRYAGAGELVAATLVVPEPSACALAMKGLILSVWARNRLLT